MEKLLCFFGHHKCATSWINRIISLVCYDLKLKHVNCSNPKEFNHNIMKFIIDNSVDFLSYTNADVNYVKQLENFVAFHIVRDPRDIVVSAYFSHLYSHPVSDWPALVEHRKRLKKVSLEEGLFIEMEFRRKQFQQMYEWDYNHPNILEIKFEDLVINPYETLARAFFHLDLLEDRMSLSEVFSFCIKSIKKRLFSMGHFKMPASIFLGYLYDNRFSKLAKGREKGEENFKSHYRKGVFGDWKNYFTESHCQYFKRHYNKLLLKLGYETHEDWTL